MIKYTCLECSWNCFLIPNYKGSEMPSECPFRMGKCKWQKDERN